MNDIENAKQLLEEKGYTCVICKGDTCYTSFERGVKPLADIVESGVNLSEFSAADKVVGMATAFIYVLLKVNVVFAKVISRSALTTLEKYGIICEYDNLVDNIINRSGDGICPFELATLDVDKPEKAYEIIRSKLKI